MLVDGSNIVKSISVAIRPDTFILIFFRNSSSGFTHLASFHLPPWRLELLGFAHQGAEEAAKRVPFVGEDAGDVFPEAGSLGLAAHGSNMVNCIEKRHVLDGEGAAGVVQAFAHAGHAECREYR